MPDFIACCWPTHDHRAVARMALFSDLAGAQPGWVWSYAAPGLRVLTPRRRAATVRELPLGRGLVVGDVFDRRSYEPAPLRLPLQGETAVSWARELVDSYWGRHVAILLQRSAPRPALFRDPSGAMDCLTWTDAGVTFVASGLPDWCRRALAPGLSIDWDRVCDMLLDPRQFAGRPALSGLASVDPGVLCDLSAKGQNLTLWSPAHIVRKERHSAPDALRDLPGLVDGCVGAFARQGGVLAEISGGLDSAIVASALSAARAKVLGWVNFHVADPDGDERAQARAVARHLGVPLIEAAKPDTVLVADRLIAAATGARPTMNIVDPDYDGQLARLARELGARSIITGQGGDTVFFQMPTPVIVADHLLQAGVSGLRSAVLPDIARWTRRSAWSVLGASLGAITGLGDPRRPPPRFLSPDLLQQHRRLEPPAWSQDLAGVPPAKRRQVHGLVYTQLFNGTCARGRQANLIHPLLSTPVVEYLLAVSAVDLTAGGRDRALARAAFADRLPTLIRERRSKGAMSAYYGRMLAASLPHLKSWLLDGPLAARGYFDRPALEARLSADDLIWRGEYPDLMAVCALQAWLGSWGVISA